MDYKVAHEISKLHMLDEQKYLSAFSTQWALIRTFAVANGTKLLVRTRQLSSADRVGRRAEDTVVFLTEMMAGDIDSLRWMTALAKVNWMHTKYKKHISNDEMIFTMAVFVIEPIKFINRWGWRPLSEMERVSRFVFWKEIGKRMGIKNIPDTLEELEVWLEDYEEREMVYADSNTACANATLELFLRGVPGLFHKPMELVARALMEKRVLNALGWKQAPQMVVVLLEFSFLLRGWAIRNLFLPKLFKTKLTKPSNDGRIYRDEYLLEPWYMKQDLWTRLRTWLGSYGRLHAGHEFGSRGYLPEEVGPPEFIEPSREKVLAQAEAMAEYASRPNSGGCPFDFGGELVWTEGKHI
jgi:ER-bound oxygenase mpaB/B'/Rubber oxygenase, catalytic domain